MRPLLPRLMASSAPASTLLIRLIVSADLFIDGIRAARWHFLLGDTRVDILSPLVSPLFRQGLGWLEVGLAILLAAGFLTRPIALLAMALPVLAGVGAYERLHSLQAASRLDIMVHAWAVALAAFFLLLHGAGTLSLDRLLTLNPRPHRFPRPRRH